MSKTTVKGKTETKAEAKKRVKDAEFIAKGKAAAQSAKVKKTAVEAAKSADILQMSGLKPADNGPQPETKASRYINIGGEFGMGIKAGTEERKPQEQEYIPGDAHIKMAASFSDGSDDIVTATIDSLKNDLGVTQGKLAAACAGIAARLQIQREGALPILNAFIDACQPWGRQLTMVRSQDIIRWFTIMSCVKYEKSETKGEGKVFSIDNDKHKKEGSRFGKDKDGWIAERIAKPFWLVKPEPALGEFDLMAELTKLIDKAATLEKKNKADPKFAERYNVLKLDGLTSLMVAQRRIATELAKQRAHEAAHGEMTEETEEEESAAA